VVKDNGGPISNEVIPEDTLGQEIFPSLAGSLLANVVYGTKSISDRRGRLLVSNLFKRMILGMV
jgi:hypothetical protein